MLAKRSAEYLRRPKPAKKRRWRRRCIITGELGIGDEAERCLLRMATSRTRQVPKSWGPPKISGAARGRGAVRRNHG